MRLFLSSLFALSLLVAVAACESSDSEGGPDVVVGTDVPTTLDTASPDEDVTAGPDVVEIPNPYPETRLDPICVGEVCAAGPDHAPDPGSMGPFPVGVMTVYLTDEEHPNAHAFLDPYGPETPRELRVEIWYPTTEEYRDGPYVGYNLVDDAPDSLKAMIGDVEIDDLAAQAVRDAPLRTEDGPYPLVVFSHGAFGVRFQNVFQTIPLASHGYIVVAPDHQYNTTWEYLEHGFQPQEVANSAQPRIYDGQFLLDTMTAWAEDVESMWYQMVAMERVGVTGHSFGGFLSLVLGGVDERVDAIIPLSPAGRVASVWAPVSELSIPTFIMGGDEDRTLEFEPDMLHIYDQIPDQKAFLRIFRGGHYTFSDMCTVDVIALAEDLGWDDAEQSLNDGCGEDNYDPASARAIISYYTNAWFNYFLRQSPGSWDYLTDERVEGLEGEVEFSLEFSEK